MNDIDNPAATATTATDSAEPALSPVKKQISDLRPGDKVMVRSCQDWFYASEVESVTGGIVKVTANGFTYSVNGDNIYPGMGCRLEVWDEATHLKALEDQHHALRKRTDAWFLKGRP